VEQFATIQVDRLILSKLDEANGLGGVLTVLGLCQRPVSYLTAGQIVPDDLQTADPTWLAHRILDHESRS
jgi:flagellar biosynthesis protein FlhF